MKRAAAERVRATWADVPAAGEGRHPQCPDARGRNGDIVFDNYEGGANRWSKVDPLGAEGSIALPSNRIAELRWSLDDERLAFGDRGELYVAKADGSEAVRVTERWRPP